MIPRQVYKTIAGIQDVPTETQLICRFEEHDDAQYYFFYALPTPSLVYVWITNSRIWTDTHYASLEEVRQKATKILFDACTSTSVTHAEPSKGTKHDAGKPRYSLLPQGVLMPVLRVLEMGCKKYSKDNWQHVEGARERYYDAAMRHINAWFEGERHDDETGESHLAHAICCLMFLLWFDN